MYIRVHKAQFIYDEDKILFVLSYMTEGDAARWAKNFYRVFFSEDDPEEDEEGDHYSTAVEELVSWKDFVIGLKKTFRDPTLKAKAIDKLKTLKQGSNSVDKYRQDFEMLIDQARLIRKENNQMLLNFAQSGLNFALVEKVYGQNKGPPTDYQEFFNDAIKYETLADRLSGIRQGRGFFPSSNRSTPQTPTQPASTVPTRHPNEPAGYSREKAGTAPANTSGWPMTIQAAKEKNICRFCGAAWTHDHDCDPKRMSRKAHEERIARGGAGTQRREVQTGTSEQQREQHLIRKIAEQEEMMAALKDQLELAKKANAS